MLGSFGLLICYLLIAYEDLKSREIHVVWFCFAIVATFYLRGFHLMYMVINFLFMVLLSAFSLGYYIGRYRHTGLARIKSQIGLGDVFMYVCMALYFSPLNFMLAFVMFHLVIIVVHMTCFRRFVEIPLAGFIALLMIGCVLFEYFHPQFFYSDVGALGLFRYIRACHESCC
jgi:hypothetical protein